MIEKSSNAVCWLMLFAAFVIVGCKTGYEKKKVISEPLVGRALLTSTNYVMSNYAERAIEASGGQEAWSRVRALDLNCVITFYQQDGSFYLTEQHHQIRPWSDYIRISAMEQQRSFVWQLAGGQFSVSGGDKSATGSPVVDWGREFAEAILSIMTAPARILDKSDALVTRPEPIKIGGLWYDLMERVSPDNGFAPFWSKVVFYQNRDSSVVDMVWFADVARNEFLAVRGYDYSQVEEGGVWAPSKVKIFKTDGRGKSQELLAKIDYAGAESSN